MIKKSPPFLFNLLGLILLFQIINSHSWAAQTGLLWQVSKPGLTPSYLFGTIHSDDPRVMKLPLLVQQHFTHADSVSVEMDLEADKLLTVLFNMYLPLDKTLDRLLPPADYQTLVLELKKQGVPEEVTKRLKPLAILVLISDPDPTGETFLDLMLYQQAKAAKQPVYGLETVDEQLAIFDLLSIPEQVILLKESLPYIEESQKLMGQLHDLYLARDLTGLLDINEQQMQKISPKHQGLMRKFMTGILDERNVRMVDRMQLRLLEGNAFIAMGALHLPGEKGILKLLEEQGYQVKALY